MRKTYTLFLILFGISWQITFAEEISKDVKGESSEGDEKEEIYIEELTEDYERIDGFLTLFRDNETNKIFLKINENQLGKEFIYFAHALNGLTTTGKFTGGYVDNGIFKIEKDFENLRFIRVLTNYSFDEESPLNKSKGSNVSDSTFHVASIMGKNIDESEFLIDITNLLISEDLTPIKPISSPDDYHSSTFGWGMVSPIKSRVTKLYNYEKNTDFEVEYVIESQPSYEYDAEDTADVRNVNIMMRYSFIEIPKNDFQPRLVNQSVGYFSDRITDLTSKDATPYGDLISKWHLKKKYPSKKISEPEEPITFWIENTTPIELREYIKEGVLAWNIAFLEAGFKDAIVVKIQPDDATWDAGDIRYNVLRWTSSPQPMFGGYGPRFTNPRTGQIIGADIMLEWVYLTNRLTIDDIFSKQENHEMCYSAAFKQEDMMLANIAVLDEEKIIEQSIKSLALHEVGHTLGLNHNFKASFLHNNDDIHNPEITSKVGITSSVMEYAPINLAPLGKEQGDYYDVVPGPYDIWAIRYGYTPNLDQEQLNNIIKESIKPELMFANDSESMGYPGYGVDPRAMTNDLSNDPIQYSINRINLLNHVQENLPEKLENNVNSWEEYRNAHAVLMRSYDRALNIISRYVGGIYVERSNPQNESTKDPYTPVPYSYQKEAMAALTEHAFSTEAFPINPKLLRLVQVERRDQDLWGEQEDPQIHKLILSMQTRVLNHLLNAKTLYRLSDTGLYGNTYSVDEMIGDLTKAIFSGDPKNQVSTIRRNLQVNYVRRLIEIMSQDYYDELSTTAVYKSLRDIQKISRKSSLHSPTKSHRKYLNWIISSALDLSN